MEQIKNINQGTAALEGWWWNEYPFLQTYELDEVQSKYSFWVFYHPSFTCFYTDNLLLCLIRGSAIDCCNNILLSPSTKFILLQISTKDKTVQWGCILFTFNLAC